MPKNYYAFMRYQVIDNCLRNRYHISPNAGESGIWTLDEIAEQCLEAIGKLPSTRTLKQDIQRMRCGELGFEAPIENCYGEGYRYSDTNFSIYTMPITESERKQLANSLQILKKFRGMPFYSEVFRILQKLDPGNPLHEFIHFEPVGIVIGYEFFEVVLKALEDNKQMKIRYKPYNEEAMELLFNGGFIKEYNRRWYIIGLDQDEQLWNLAFDRIESIELLSTSSQQLPETIYEKHKQIVGVTVPQNGKVNKIRFRVQKDISPYFNTKPLHHSQIIKQETEDYIVFELEAMVNIELISKLMAFGEAIKVERPAFLVNAIKHKLEECLLGYN
ncbi:MAG: WYL domain-containing protein [Bacteroidales bacterium]|nr:WYL domain-containing protein [Bacteroidales bacterium]